MQMLGLLAWSGVCACRDCGHGRPFVKFKRRSIKRREAIEWRRAV